MQATSRRDVLRSMLTVTGLLATDHVMGVPVIPAACRTSTSVAPAMHSIIFCDRTFNPDRETREWLGRAVKELLTIDDALIQVGGFSTAGGRDGATLGEPLMRPQPPDAMRSKSLRRSQVARQQKCHRAQAERVEAEVSRSVQATLGAHAGTATNSDIAASLSIVARAFKVTAAPRRLLLVISDGIEHHAEQSFYRDRKPRQIVPAEELEILKRRDIPSDLTAVEVLWAGLGSAQAAVDWSVFRSLQRYWTEVIELQRGQPIELATTPGISVQQLLQRPRSAPTHLASQQGGIDRPRGAAR